MTSIVSIADLQALPNWIVFGQEPQPDGKKPKKIPYIPGTTTKARANDPATWRTFAEARADGRPAGVALTPAMDLTLLDIDGRIDHELIATFDSYAEESINGGLHILVRGRPPAGFVAPTGIEVYPRDGNRFVLITGTLINGRSVIEDRTELLAELFPPASPAAPLPSTPLTLADDELLTRAFAAVNGAELERLLAGDLTGYEHPDGKPDRSRADLAAASKLAFWTQDAAQIERIISESTLGDREKWRKRSSYRDDTIARALHRSEFYTPPATIVRPDPSRRPTVPTVDPCTAERDLIAELRAEIGALRAENEQLRAERDQAKRDLSMTMQTLANTNLGGDAAGKALILAAAEVQHRSHTVPPSDGYVQVNATRIADRTVYVDGEPVPVPARISPRTVTKYIGLAAEAGLIDARKDEIPAPAGKPAIKNEGWYWRAAPTLADQLAPLAGGSVYSDDNPRPLRGGDPAKRRRLRTLPGCPECGGHHVACATCGTFYDTPAAVDLDSGQTLSPAEVPADDAAITPAVVDRTYVDNFAEDPRAHTVPPERSERRVRAAADLAARGSLATEPAWLTDAPDPWDSPPQPALFPIDDLPPGQSFHFSAD